MEQRQMLWEAFLKLYMEYYRDPIYKKVVDKRLEKAQLDVQRVCLEDAKTLVDTFNRNWK